MGVPPSTLPDVGLAPGPASHRAGTFPAPSPKTVSAALVPGQRRVGKPRVGGLWHVFSRAAGALLIFSGCRGSCALRAPGVGEGVSSLRPRCRPWLPRAAVGRRARGAPPEGGGSEASGGCGGVGGVLNPQPVPLGG